MGISPRIRKFVKGDRKSSRNRTTDPADAGLITTDEEEEKEELGREKGIQISAASAGSVIHQWSHFS